MPHRAHAARAVRSQRLGSRSQCFHPARATALLFRSISRQGLRLARQDVRLVRLVPVAAAAGDYPPEDGDSDGGTESGQDKRSDNAEASDLDELGGLDIDSIIEGAQRAGEGADGQELDQIFERIGYTAKGSAGRSTGGTDAAGGAAAGDGESESAPLVDYPPVPERRVRFGQILEKAGYDEEVQKQYADCLDIEVTGIHTNSREVVPESMFVCITGPLYNGHHFLPDAIDNGTALIIARLLVPGADLALHADVDPRDPRFSGLFVDNTWWRSVDCDARQLARTAEAIEASYERLQGFGDEHGLSNHELETLQTENAARILGATFNYDFSHWERPDDTPESDLTFTPHPLNPTVPMEVTQPVAFAIDPADFGGVLADAFYDQPSRRMVTAGVTGTYGKTTVAWLLRAIFEQAGHLTGLMSTVEWAIATDRVAASGALWAPDKPDTTADRECSSPFWLAPYEGKYAAPCTTPDAVAIQRVLAGIADRGASACVLEASKVGLARGSLEYVDLDLAIFTNLHAEAHGDDEGELTRTFELLFDQLSEPERQRAIINLDGGAASEALAAAAKDVPVVTYSESNPDADVYVSQIHHFSIWETDMTVETPLGSRRFVTPLVGRTNVPYILAALAAAISVGLSLDDAVKAIENAEVVPGRYQLIDEGQDFAVVVDAARTPAALEALLSSVRECAETKRVILVIGANGGPDGPGRAERRELAAVAHRLSDIVILTNDSPGLEAPELVIADLVSGFPESVTHAYPGSVYNHMVDVGRIPPVFEDELLTRQGELLRHVIEDRYSAIRAAIVIAQPGDAVVIAGKGATDWQLFSDVDGNEIKGWFDDRVEARAALTRLPFLQNIKYLQRKTLPLTRAGD